MPQNANPPSREPSFDVLPGFVSPPPGYGEVAFYWWLGDKLTKERLSWQLDQMAGWKISGLQVNYAHGTKGGQLWGLTYPSDPPLFSEPWWELYVWFQGEAEKRGMAVSLSDYTLGSPGQGYFIDEILAEHPDMTGSTLEPVVAADGSITVKIVNHPSSLDPMHPRAGAEVIAKFFQRFEDRLPGKAGTGLNFFFSDELNFGVAGNLWNDRFAAEFVARKGYDLMPLLPHLFAELGPQTPKIRLDYRDVMVALEEEAYFQPVYQWHEDRGMTYGCDHGGRGKDVLEFGDYFRTQKWNQAPGNDNPNLESDLIKNKVASSIAHLYERPRTWLEGFYGSGWGTSTAQVTDALFRNFVMGHNLVSLHGLYYSTHGGWWEWAPPCNHFRMPYARHMKPLLEMSERVSYLLSQGVHCCDVAVLYPVTPAEAGLGGEAAVAAAFSVAEALYGAGVDFDFVDAQSLDRAVAGRELAVAGESYRVLVLPALRALRHGNLQKALAFHRAGGLVLLLGSGPEATDRIGLGDPEVAQFNAELADRLVASNGEVLARIRAFTTPDVLCLTEGSHPWVLHRRVGFRDVYAVYGAREPSECFFRVHGAAELWNPWTGAVEPLSPMRTCAEGTVLSLPLGAGELQLVVFDTRSAPAPMPPRPAPQPTSVLHLEGSWQFELLPTRDNRWGDFALPAGGILGAEVHHLWWSDGSGPERRVRTGFGPAFLRRGPQTDGAWEPYEVSTRFGVEDDAGAQGYHGLKGEVSDGFLVMGRAEFTPTDTVYHDEGTRPCYQFRTSVNVERATRARVSCGELRPVSIELDGRALGAAETLDLTAGVHAFLLTYDRAGRTWFVLETPEAPTPWTQSHPLAMAWYRKPGVLEFDALGARPSRVERFRFLAPPGLQALEFRAWGTPRVGVGGAAATVEAVGPGTEPRLWRVEVDRRAPCAEVVLEFDAVAGHPGAAVFDSPLALTCGGGTLELGDWSQIDGLRSYSGGARYSRDFEHPQPGQRCVLDLGRVVSSAEVHVNGALVGVRVAPPWTFDLTKHLVPGSNRLEVLVFNTLSNHYTTIPTRYRGSLESGLIGPVRLFT